MTALYFFTGKEGAFALIQLTYRYRIYPTEQQKKDIYNIFSCTRYVYNKALEERTDYYRQNKKWMKIDREKLFSSPFLQSVDRKALDWSVSSLEAAYRQFFRKKNNEKLDYKESSFLRAQQDPEYELMETDLKWYPNFKKKKDSQVSYTTYLPTFFVRENHFYLPSVGDVKIKYHRPLPEDSKHICLTVLKKRSGEYYILIRFILRDVPEKKELDKSIGILYEPGQLAIRSDAVPVSFNHQSQAQRNRIRKAYQTLKRRTPGSKRYEEQREYLASLYEHRANQRKDSLHKIARQITNAGDVFYLQQPDVHGMLGSSTDSYQSALILDEAWWTFASYLKYKARLTGKHYWDVHRSYPIYSTCSFCGYWTKEQTDTIWICPQCNALLVRNMNAAKVLEGLGNKYIQERMRNAENN